MKNESLVTALKKNESLITSWKEIQLQEKKINEKKRAIAKETLETLQSIYVDKSVVDTLLNKLYHYPADVSPAKVLKILTAI